jgi:hypothetical protein
MITESTDPADSSSAHNPDDDGHEFISPDPEAQPKDSADDDDSDADD